MLLENERSGSKRETSFVHLLCTQTHKHTKMEKVGIIICLVIFTGVATKSQTSFLIKRSRKNNEYFVVQLVNWERQNSEKEIKLELAWIEMKLKRMDRLPHMQHVVYRCISFDYLESSENWKESNVSMA